MFSILLDSQTVYIKTLSYFWSSGIKGNWEKYFCGQGRS